MKHFLILFLLLSFSLFAKKERIYIADPTINLNAKDAILILPGFGSKIQGTEKIADFFFHKGLDVFIPSYISRNSISGCVKNLNNFIDRHSLKQYRRVFVFSYIVGSWTINSWILNNPDNNIAAIVYDRSPLQERAPYALVKDIPLLIRIISGKIMREFSRTPYPPVSNLKMKVGIVIESKATKLLTKHRKSALALGPVSWNVDNLNQVCDDKFYTWLNHDEMYTRFDITGDDILFFFANGKFSDKARREPYIDDPFIKQEQRK